MPLVLAIEPDPRQAATLKRVVKANVRAKLLVVDSKDAALAAIADSMPDVLLVTALLPPRDEDELTRHLKALSNAGHLQTLTIPLFAGQRAEEKTGGLFGGLRRKKRAPTIAGCDPNTFGEQVEVYLQRATELREEQQAIDAALAQAAAAAPTIAQESPEPLSTEPPADEPPAYEAPAYEAPAYEPASVVRDAIFHAPQDAAIAGPAVEEQEPALEEPAAPPAPVMSQEVAAWQAASTVSIPAPPIAGPGEDDDAADWQEVSLEDQSDLATGGETEPTLTEPASEPMREAIEQPAIAETVSTEHVTDQDPWVEGRTIPAEALEPSAEANEEPAVEEIAQAPTIVAAAAELEAAPMAATEPEDVDLAPAVISAEPAQIEPAAANVPHAAGAASEDVSAAVSAPVPTVPARARDSSDVVHSAFAHALRNLHAVVARMKARSTVPSILAVQVEHPDPTPRTVEPAAAPLAAAVDMHHAVAAADVVVAREERGAVDPDDARKDAKDGDTRKKRRRRRTSRAMAGLEAVLAGVESRWLRSAIAALRVDIQQMRAEARTAAEGTTPDPVPPASPTPVVGSDLSASARPASPPRYAETGAHAAASEHTDGSGARPDQDSAAPPVHKAKAPAPEEDEWGLYNPERCGMQALMARLEESDASASTPKQPPAPAVQPSRPAPQPVEPNWQDFAAGADDPDTARRSFAALAQPAASTLSRLAPLAMWARGEPADYRIEDILPAAASTSRTSPTGGLRLPDEVAGVRYGSGARIRRVRVAPSSAPRVRDGKRQVVILSRKVLDELR